MPMNQESTIKSIYSQYVSMFSSHLESYSRMKKEHLFAKWMCENNENSLEVL